MYGDTAVIRRRVGDLREQADEVRSRARGLVAQAEGVPWSGRAAETLRTRVRDRAARLTDAAALHDDAAESLERHLAEVDRLQEAIASAEHRERDRTGSVDGPAAEPPPPGHRDWLTWTEAR